MNGIIKLATNLVIELLKVMAKRGGQRFAIIGKSGGGKTNTLKVFAEQWLKNGWPLVIIDPMNNFRSLRDSGLPLIVAGMRKSADIRFIPETARQLAAFSFTERVSIVLDTSFHEPGEDIEALKEFLETLWRLTLRQDEDAARQPFAILIDEAHLFIPQSGKTEITDLLIDISKRGRQMNVSMAFTTQRPAAIDKEFLTQSNVLIAHKVSFGDVGVVAAAFSQPPRVINTTMKQLIAGQALVSGDADLVELKGEDFILAQIDEWQATEGERFLSVLQGATALRPIDPAMIAKLRATMKGGAYVETFISIEEAKELRQKIKDLEDEIAFLKGEGEPDEPDEESDDGVVEHGLFVQSASGNGELIDRAVFVNSDKTFTPNPDGTFSIAYQVAFAQGAEFESRDTVPANAIQIVGPTMPGGPKQVLMTAHNVGLPDEPAPLPTVGSKVEPLDKGARKVLTKLADIFPMHVTRKQLATLTNYTDGGGKYNAIWSQLKKGCFINDLPSHVEITIAGFKYLQRQPRMIPMTHHELMQMWREVLPERTFEMLTLVVRHSPQGITVDDLALLMDMTAGGGGFNSHIGKLRLNNLIVRDKLSGKLTAHAQNLKLS